MSAPTSAAAIASLDALLALEMDGKNEGLFSSKSVVPNSAAAPPMNTTHTRPLSTWGLGSGFAMLVTSDAGTVCAAAVGAWSEARQCASELIGNAGEGALAVSGKALLSGDGRDTGPPNGFAVDAAAAAAAFVPAADDAKTVSTTGSRGAL
eukprot:365978-Chlamydomonas_euryale.AAC.6